MSTDFKSDDVGDRLRDDFHAAFGGSVRTPPFRGTAAPRARQRVGRVALLVGAALLVATPAAAVVSQTDLVKRAFSDMGVRDKTGAPADYRVILAQEVSSTLTVKLYSSSGEATSSTGKAGTCYFTEFIQQAKVVGGKGWCGTPSPEGLPTVIRSSQFILVQSANRAPGTATITSASGEIFRSTFREGFAIFPPFDSGAAKLVDGAGSTESVDIP